MKKTVLITIALLVTVSLLGFSCTKKAAEDKLESDIEKATNGTADVDLDDNTLKVNTNEGSVEVGENVSLPSDFPSDVHVIDGNITASTVMSDIDGYSVTVQTDDSVTDAKEEYESQLVADGWEITMTFNLEGVATVGAQKDDRTVTISITDSDDGAMVMIGTSTNQ